MHNLSDIIAFISGMKKVLYISCVLHPKIACKENGKGNKRRARVGEKPKPEAKKRNRRVRWENRKRKGDLSEIAR